MHAQGPAYTSAQLHCARYAETSHSDIETQTGPGALQATAERAGVWSFRARDSSGVLLEAWLDSLTLVRRTGDTEVRPDTDGLIGGRYRGVLDRTGRYAEIARPFVPDEVAEVADLSAAGRDLLPRLPPRALAPGETWADSGLSIRRLPDTVVAGRPLLRFELEGRAETRESVPRGDTVPVALRQVTVERGAVYWSPVVGLVRRTREIEIEASVPTGGRIRQPVRSRVTQRIELTRLPSQPGCR